MGTAAVSFGNENEDDDSNSDTDDGAKQTDHGSSLVNGFGFPFQVLDCLIDHAEIHKRFSQ